MMNDSLDLPGGDEYGEGPSSPRPKRLKISVQSNAVDGDDRECQGSFSYCFHPEREQNGKHCEVEGEQETYEEEEEEEEEEDPGSTVTVRPRLVTLTDPEVLDCYICFEPLSSPVFQCKNGHIACSSCCIKLGNTCPSCCYPIGHIRCRAIENVLESAKISCRNTKYGCKEAVGYSKQNDHEKTCIYAPCSCPLFLGCNFVASSKQLYKHFCRKHPTSATSFMYNCVFSVSLNVKGQFVVLQEQNDNALFVLNNRDEHLGNLVTVCCIGPCSSTRGFPFTLEAKIHGSSVRLRSFTKNSQNWLEEPPSTGFLLIPSGFYGSCDQIKLDVCIQRNAAC